MNNDPLKALRSLSAERLNASETKAAAAPANSTPARADNETGTADRVKSVRELAGSFEAWTAENAAGSRCSTGIAALDIALSGGFPRCGSGILFANTSLGKSTLIDQIAVSYCRTSGNPITAALIFSTENDNGTTIAKCLNAAYFAEKVQTFRQSGKVLPDLNIEDFDTGRYKLHPEAAACAEQFFNEMGDRLYLAEHIGALDTSAVETEFTTWQERLRACYVGQQIKPLVIVDLMNHVHPDSEQQDKRQEIDQALIELRQFALDRDLFVLCVCSANRTAYNVPLDCNALKESGGLENFADLVMGLDVIREKAEASKSNGLEKTYYAERASRDEKKYGARLLYLIIFKNRKGSIFQRLNCAYYPKNDYFEIDPELCFKSPTEFKEAIKGQTCTISATAQGYGQAASNWD